MEQESYLMPVPSISKTEGDLFNFLHFKGISSLFFKDIRFIERFIFPQKSMESLILLWGSESLRL